MTPELSADVVVVGAGPAGVGAAITLADAGRKVVVIDKATFPRDKFCGDGLTTGCLRLLDHIGLDTTTVPSFMPVSDVHLSPPKGVTITFPLPKGNGLFAAVATRTDLDHALVRLARQRGVEILEGTACTAVCLEPDHVEVEAEGVGHMRAQWLIAADGMWSPTRKMLGMGDRSYRGEWHAFRQYFSSVGPAAATELHVWFEPDVLPGYIWSFPLPGNRANVGFGILRGRQDVGSMKAIWNSLFDRPRIAAILGPDAQPEGQPRAWPIPARIGEVPLAAHRTFFVGDAAASCDPMTGEGIGQALQTGLLAARSVLDAGSGVDAALHARQRYERDVEAELAVDMRFAGRLGKVLGSNIGAQRSLKLAGANDWTRRNFARWLFEDYPRAVLGTPSRWSRDMFSQPGSYR